MKKIFIILFASIICGNLVAQSEGELNDYRRNSLATMMVYHSEDTFGIHIWEAFKTIPTPDKYDNHSFGWNVLENDSLTGAKRKSNGLIKAQYGKQLTPKDVLKNAQVLEKKLNEQQVAKFMVAKWFGMDVTDSLFNAANGFNLDLIQQRGQYNASDLDVANALNTTRGIAMLEDAGYELINNTFVLVNDITYVTAEEKAAAAKIAMSVIGNIFDALLGTDLGSQMASVGGSIADSFTGFTVKTHSYLFQLVWNEDVANTFYDKYYVGIPTCKEDTDRIVAFWEDTELFRLKYVAHEYEFDAKSTLKGKYSREELVKTVCTQSIDKNIAALQLAYEDFKVKTPVYEVVTNNKGKVIGYSAKIGMKEGVNLKSSFQVVQRIVDPETNRTKYRAVGTLVPMKGKIWDNRYNAVLEGNPGSNLTATVFKKKGAGEILPGMLIIEGKYSKAKK